MAYGPASDPDLKKKSSSATGPASAGSSSGKTTGPASSSYSSSGSSYSSGSSSKGPASDTVLNNKGGVNGTGLTAKEYADFEKMSGIINIGANPSALLNTGSAKQPMSTVSDTYYSSLAKDTISKGNVNDMYKLLSELEGVDKSTLSDVQKSSLFSAKKKLNSQIEKMEKYGDYYGDLEDYLSNMLGSASMQGIPSSVLNILGSSYEMSDKVKQAYATTNDYLQKLSSGKTPYTDKLNGLIENYEKRDPFSYNPDEDVMFQNALASAMRNGQTAMQDTMGQAAALTGGYGSSYATTAANQTYNQFINEAYDNLPQYYQMAMQAYGLEDERLLQEIGLVADQDAKEYEKLYNAWSANYQNANDLYKNEYNEYLTDVNNAMNSYNIFSDSVNTAMKWNQMEQEADRYKQEMEYKYAALAQDQQQFEANLALQQEKMAAAAASASGGGSNRSYYPSNDSKTNTVDVKKEDITSWKKQASNILQQEGYKSYTYFLSQKIGMMQEQGVSEERIAEIKEDVEKYVGSQYNNMKKIKTN